MSSEIKIGYIGLGSLGSAIFPNLADYAKSNNLPAPVIWNRSQEKYAPIQQVHPEVVGAKAVEEVVEKCNVIFTCLVNDAAAEEVYGKLVAALNAREKGTEVIFADQTTLKAATGCESRQIDTRMLTVVLIKEKVEQAGGIYLTNTVFGQPAAARARQLVVVSSGPARGRERALPLFEYICKKVIDVGEDNAKGECDRRPSASMTLTRQARRSSCWATV
jgi:3-hydroxyisobutyrate dehydrogenase-like beta-hydroxyacid dehydrogenase